MGLRIGSESGKSLIELTIVLMVAGILVAMAVARIGNAQSGLQRQNYAKEFKVMLERARFDSVKRRAVTNDTMARLVLTSATAYNVFTDLNQDGALLATESRQISLSNNIRMVGTDLVYPVTIRFANTGAVTAVNASGTAVPLVFTFCDGSCTLQNANSSNATVVSVSSSGTVVLVAGGESLPSVLAPNVSAVNANTGVNPWVVIVPGSDVSPTPTPSPTSTPQSTPTPTPTQQATPTPTPTPQPTPTPSQTPAPTPNPTPTPAPTPTPTPTPAPTPTPTATPAIVYCTSGQKPTLNNCTCKLPMTVRTNGKCM